MYEPYNHYVAPNKKKSVSKLTKVKVKYRVYTIFYVLFNVCPNVRIMNIHTPMLSTDIWKLVVRNNYG